MKQRLLRTLMACAVTAGFLTAAAAASAQQAKGEWIADTTTGCKVWNPNPQPAETVSWDGPCENGIANGTGAVQWFADGKKGSRNNGTYVDGRRVSGKGGDYFPDGAKYEGDFVDGGWTGKGSFTWPDGRNYIGDFLKGRLHGKGVYSWPDGTKYEGDFVEGKKQGKGVFTGTNGKYEGDYVNDNWNGKGRITTASGNTYDGDFLDGKESGRGVFSWADGKKYSGEFLNGVSHGTGVFVWPESNRNCGSELCYKKYQGEFQNGKRTCGVMEFWNGDAYEGCFDADGKMQGKTRSALQGQERKEKIAASMPQGSVMLAARLLQGNSLRTSTCSFFYPFNDDFRKAGSKAETAEEQYAFWWNGACKDGFVDGTGDLGIATINKAKNTHNLSNSDEFNFKNIAFDAGKQNGPLELHSNRNTYSGTASNFGYQGIFRVLVPAKCLESGFLFCKSWGSDSTYYAMWKTSPASHPSHWDETEFAMTCSSDRITPEQCRWTNDNGNALRKRISDASDNGQCKQMAALIKEAIQRGGMDYYSESNMMSQCNDNAAFASAVNGSDPQRMFLSAGQYESRGDRSRAKTIYNSIVSRFPKSPVAVHATNRLTALADVEAVESASSRAQAASYEAARSVRSQNYQQCIERYNACQRSCDNLSSSSSRSSCRSGCASCTQ